MAEDEQGTQGDAEAPEATVKTPSGEFTPPLAEPGGGRPPSNAIGGGVCPSCGVAVAPGYPKCPKCHTGLPVLPSPLTRATTPRPERVTGTSVAADGPQGWLLGLLAGVIALGVVVYFASSGDDDGAATLSRQARTAAVGDGLDVAIAGPGLGDDSPGDESDELELSDDDVGGNPEVLVELRAQLQVSKLWSTVFVNPGDSTAIVVESDQCDDQDMSALVDRMLDTLDEAGFAKVTCLSKFGATVFENQWRKPAGEANDTDGASGAE